jgi:hypothetical protein
MFGVIQDINGHGKPCAFLLVQARSRGFELLSTTGEDYLKQKVT